MEKKAIGSNVTLALPYDHTENSLRQYLEERLNRPVALVFTENSTSMLSARMRDGILRVRLHRMFNNADSRVMEEVTSFLNNKKGAMSFFRGFVREHREQLTKRPPNRVPLRTHGEFQDLRKLFDEVNEEYFAGTINAAITWGASSPRCFVRKRTLGSYSERSHTIRINPALDKRQVPRYFVAFVVYHEMLHAAIGVSRKGGRRSVHPREFRQRERLFKDYERAMAWERTR